MELSSFPIFSPNLFPLVSFIIISVFSSSSSSSAHFPSSLFFNFLLLLRLLLLYFCQISFSTRRNAQDPGAELLRLLITSVTHQSSSVCCCCFYCCFCRGRPSFLSLWSIENWEAGRTSLRQWWQKRYDDQPMENRLLVRAERGSQKVKKQNRKREGKKIKRWSRGRRRWKNVKEKSITCCNAHIHHRRAAYAYK